MENVENKREPIIAFIGKRGVGSSKYSESKPDAFMMAEKFMLNLKLNDKFTLNGKRYFVKRIGKYHTVINGVKKSFRKMTIKTYSEKVEMFIDDDERLRRSFEKYDGKVEGCNEVTFFFWGGINGNPRSRQRNADAKQHNFMRDIEGQLIVDLINRENPLHEPSEIFKMCNQL